MRGPQLNTNMMKKRIIVFTIYVTGMFLFFAWKAKLISHFTFPSRIFPFNSWEELSTKTEGTWRYRLGWMFQLEKTNDTFFIAMSSSLKLHFILFTFLSTAQLVLHTGTLNEQFFRDTSDPVKQKIWMELILPNINDSIYRVLC